MKMLHESGKPSSLEKRGYFEGWGSVLRPEMALDRGNGRCGCYRDKNRAVFGSSDAPARVKAHRAAETVGSAFGG